MPTRDTDRSSRTFPCRVHMRVATERIETGVQSTHLRTPTCDEGQGSFFSRLLDTREDAAPLGGWCVVRSKGRGAIACAPQATPGTGSGTTRDDEGTGPRERAATMVPLGAFHSKLTILGAYDVLLGS